MIASARVDYNLNRTYNPATGRYLEADPIGLDGGWNVYGYANQNPVNYFDLRGLECFSCQAQNAGGVDYKDGIKQCRYRCTGEDGKPFEFDGPGDDDYYGDLCHGAVPATRPTPMGGFTRDTSRLEEFQVDTDSLYDKYFKYSNGFSGDFVESLENAAKSNRRNNQ